MLTSSNIMLALGPSVLVYTIQLSVKLETTITNTYGILCVIEALDLRSLEKNVLTQASQAGRG